MPCKASLSQRLNQNPDPQSSTALYISASRMSYYIGLMSGTSADGIDAVMVSIEDENIDFIKSISVDYDKSLLDDIVAITSRSKIDLIEIGELDVRLGLAFSNAVLSLTQSVDLDLVAAIGSHGQTVHHSPEGNYPFTMQLGSGATIAQTTGIRTVTDFRSNDIAAGGQGAPLAPLFHQEFFSSTQENRSIINIGGIANLTYLSKSHDHKNGRQITGFDTGPGNALLDCWASLHLNTPYDTNGDWARSGKIDRVLLQRFLADPYFKKPPPKSTGKEYFNLRWLKDFFDIETVDPTNIQTTLTHLTALSIANCLNENNNEHDAVYLCGGGTKNLYLMEQIEHYSNKTKIGTTMSLGIDPDFVEAVAFAWLAKTRIEEKALDTRLITGASRPVILGAVYLAT